MPSPQMGQLLNKLKGVKSKGNGGFVALCPSHDDKQRSLSIDERDGTILLKCFVGCTVDSIMAAIGSRSAALFADSDNDSKPAYTASKGTGKRTLYDIHVSERTRPIASHVRTDYADGTKTFHWEINGKIGLGDLKLAGLPLYRQWLLRTLTPAPEFIIIVEGEKACDALWNKGYAAIATYGADAVPSLDRLQTIADQAVFLWPDNDDLNPKTGLRPGQAHMDKIAMLLTTPNCPPLIIHWKDAPPKGDAYDYIAAGLDVGLLLGEAKLYEDSWIYKASEKTILNAETRGQGHDFDHLL